MYRRDWKTFVSSALASLLTTNILGIQKNKLKVRFSTRNHKLIRHIEKLLLSGDVQRYIVEWNGKDWIKYGQWLAAPREQRFFKQERILVQQIIDWSSLRILVGWTDKELYNTQNQFNLLALNGTNLKFILAIFNSQLMSFYHRQVFLDVALQRFQKILVKDAKTLPIRRINFTTPADERDRQLEKAKTLYQFCLDKGSIDCVLGFVTAPSLR